MIRFPNGIVLSFVAALRGFRELPLIIVIQLCNFYVLSQLEVVGITLMINVPLCYVPFLPEVFLEFILFASDSKVL